MSFGRKIVKASIGVSLIMVLAHILSFVKEALIANYFGVSYIVDAYTIAIQVPVLLFSFVSVAIQSIVVPVYSDIFYNEGKDKAREYINHLMTILLLFTVFLVVIGECFAGELVYLSAPGFDDVTHQLSTHLLRITFPTIIMAIVGQVLVAVLNVHKRFVLPSFAVFFMNVSMIIAIVLLHKELGITSACIGQLIGDLLRALFLIIIARKFYHYSFAFNLHDVSVKKTLKLSVPVFFSISIAEVNAIVNRIVGSLLIVGSISAITYANKINTVLMQLFVSAIATVVYPLYAESSAKGNMSQLNTRINLTLSVYALFVVPLMFGVFVFKKELIEVAFARGVFDKSAVELTQNLLGLYAIGMLFMAIRTPITNVYYSLKNTKTPAINASIGAIINIVLNILLAHILGVQGIAIATSITAVYITTSLTITLMHKYKEIRWNYFFNNLSKIVLASIVMFIVLIFAKTFLQFKSFYILVVGALIGLLVYVVNLLILKVMIVKKLLQLLKK